MTAGQRNIFRACCVALAIGCAAGVWACSVPVFRYALERWPPDRFDVLVFGQGPLTPENSPPLKRLQQAFEGGRAPANLILLTFDTAGPQKIDEASRRIWQAHQAQAAKSKQPWMVVRFPAELRIDKDVWAGPLTEEVVEQLLVSPKRTELARRVLSGDSVVWVLLESGDKAKDDQAAKLLDDELKRLVKELHLPQIEESDQRYVSTSGPELKLAFSTLRLSRTDPQERMLLAMLTAEAPGAAAKQPGPAVVPVFGRGRALTVLTGEDLKRETIEEVAAFLTGECSCQAKEAHPGVDLLISADWDGLISGQFTLAEALPRLTTPTALAQAKQILPAGAAAPSAPVQLEAPAEPSEPAEEAAAADPLVRNLVIAAVIGVGAVLAAIVVIQLRGSKIG